MCAGWRRVPLGRLEPAIHLSRPDAPRLCSTLSAISQATNPCTHLTHATVPPLAIPPHIRLSAAWLAPSRAAVCTEALCRRSAAPANNPLVTTTEDQYGTCLQACRHINCTQQLGGSALTGLRRRGRRRRGASLRRPWRRRRWGSAWLLLRRGRRRGGTRARRRWRPAGSARPAHEWRRRRAAVEARRGRGHAVAHAWRGWPAVEAWRRRRGAAVEAWRRRRHAITHAWGWRRRASGAAHAARRRRRGRGHVPTLVAARGPTGPGRRGAALCRWLLLACGRARRCHGPRRRSHGSGRGRHHACTAGAAGQHHSGWASASARVHSSNKQPHLM